MKEMKKKYVSEIKGDKKTCILNQLNELINTTNLSWFSTKKRSLHYNFIGILYYSGNLFLT